MSRTVTMGVGPSLLIGISVLGATALAAVFSHSAWLALLGPALLAAMMLGARFLGPIPEKARRNAVQMAIILGASLFVASGIVVMSDPSMLAVILPVLGGSTAGVLVTTPWSNS